MMGIISKIREKYPNLKYYKTGVVFLCTIVLVFCVCLTASTYVYNKTLVQERKLRIEGDLDKMVANIENRSRDLSDSIWSIIVKNKTKLFHIDSAFEFCKILAESSELMVAAKLQYEPYCFPEKKLYAPAYVKDYDGEVYQYDIVTVNNKEYDYTKEDEDYQFCQKTLQSKWTDITYTEGYGDFSILEWYTPWISDKKKAVVVVGAVFDPMSLIRAFELYNPFPNGKLYIVGNDNKMLMDVDSDVMPNQDFIQTMSVRYSEDVCDTISACLSQIQSFDFTQNNSKTADNGDMLVYIAYLREMQWKLIYICNTSGFYAWTPLVIAFIVLLIALVIISVICVKQMNKTAQMAIGKITAKKDLETASGIQMSLLPKELHGLGTFDIDARLIPAKEVCGDMYFYMLCNGRIYFCIGDVAGKGVPAAIFMTRVVTLFSNYVLHGVKAADIAKYLNSELCYNNEQNMFVTMFIGVLQLSTGKLKYCNAGHQEPLIWNGETFESLAFAHTAVNLPLGVDSDTEYKTGEVVLNPNSYIVLYTDGVDEAKNIKHEMFGAKRLLDAVSKVKFGTVEQINSAIIDSVHLFVNGYKQSDDIAVLSLKYNGGLLRHLTITNEASNLKKLKSFLGEFIDKSGIAKTIAVSLRTALDEAVTNVVLYAYEKKGMPVDLTAKLVGDDVVFTLVDEGKAFDPTKYKSENTAPFDLDAMKIGGLGIILIKKIFDKVEYRRENNKNILTLTKSLNYGIEN